MTVIFGDFPAKNTVCTPYVYGFGQPYIYVVLANPIISDVLHV
jgi:hypothetical protein